MELTITWTGGSLTINVEDNSYHYEQVMGDNNLHLTFKTSEYVEIPLGAVVAFQNVSYKLCVPATIKKQSSTSFEIEAVFESPQYALKKYTMREYRYNENSGQWDNSTPSLQFSLTATPLEHLKMIRDNLNKREGDNVWSIGSCITDKEKTLTFDYTNVWDALNNLATEFNTEWRIAGTVLYLGKVEFNKTQPLSLSYGKGNGFKSGVGRTNYGDTMPIEVLNVQGTDRNIDFSKYGTRRLRLPANQSFQYEDGGAFKFGSEVKWKIFNESTGQWDEQNTYTPTNAQSYATDGHGDTVYITNRQTYQEANFDGTEIYPCRYGYLTSVTKITGGEQDLWDITDDTPDMPNYNDYRIGDDKITIVFQTGMLAGREFEVAKYNHATKTFELVNEEIDGQLMPSEPSFKPRGREGTQGQPNYYEGDKYAVFGCMLPDSYVCDTTHHTGASFDMLRAAVKYLHENKNAKYTFSGELDGIFAKNQWATLGGRLRIGEYVSFTDSNFQSTSVLIRIIGVKQYINNPYSPEIEMSNDSIGSTLISEVRKAQAQEVTTEILNRETIRYAKRRFTDAKQTSEAIEQMVEELGEEFGDFTKGITPATVQTMQLLVGSENLQFAFGDIVSQSGSNYFVRKTLNASFNTTTKIFTLTLTNEQYLMHYTLGRTFDNNTMTTSAGNKVWKLAATLQSGSLEAEPDKYFYVYIKAKKSDSATFPTAPTSTSNNSLYLSETAVSMDDGQTSGYYYFLVGILNSEKEGDRSFAEMFGYSEILPNRITTDKIMSSDGQGVVIDLVNGIIKGNITFEAGTTSYDALQGIISGNTTVQGAVTTANRAEGKIDNLEIGGKNLLRGTEAITVVSRDFDWAHAKFYKSGTGTLENVTLPDSPIPSVTKGIKATITNATQVGIAQNAVPLSKREMTQSVWVKGTAGDTIALQTLWSDSSGASESGAKYFTIADSNWHRYVFTKTPNYDHLDGVAAGYVYVNSATNGHVFYICAEKLEYGNKATDWTPAPEDTEAELTALQSDLQAQIDSKIETWSQVADPSTAWTTTVLKDQHVGDLWYYTGETTSTRTNNKTYKYTKSGNTYSWVEHSAGGGDLFDKIDGKTAIWYGSPSDHPAQGETVEEDDYLVDGTTGTTYKYAPNITPNTNGWVTLQDYQTAIANIQIGGKNLVFRSATMPAVSSGVNGWRASGGVVTHQDLSTPPTPSVSGAIRVTNSGSATASVGMAQDQHTVNFKKNDELTESFFIRASSNLGNTYVRFQPFWVSSSVASGSKIVNLTTEWQLVSHTLKVTADYSGTASLGYVYIDSMPAGAWFEVCALKVEQGNKATDWSPAPEDGDAEARARLDNIDSDSVFSIAEKEAYRTDFEKIVGVGIAVNGTIPTAVQLNNSTYAKGSYYQHYNMINSTATNTLTALSTAYTNLRDYLVGNTCLLYTQQDTSGFSRTTLAGLICAYLDAEKDVEIYAENVGNMKGTISTAAATATKQVAIDTMDGLITADMARDMLADADMRMAIVLSADNTAQNITLQFYYASGSIIPTGRSSADCYLQYLGVRTNQNCYWKSNMVLSLQYDTIDNSLVRFKLTDEENFATVLAFGKAMQGKTTVAGGLVLTETIVAGEGRGQSGMSGANASDNVAFWAGGTVGAAMTYNVPVVIMRDGTARFGLLRLNNDTITMHDTNETPRLNIVKGTVPTPTVADVKRNNSSTTPDSPVWSSFSGSGSLATLTTEWTKVFDAGFVQNCSEIHNGMPVHVRGASNNTFRIQVTAADSAAYSLTVYIRIGDDNVIQIYHADYLFGSQDINVEMQDRYAAFYTSGSSGSCALVAEAQSLSGNISLAVAVSNLQDWYYHDSSKSVTTLASDGLGVIVDNENNLVTKEVTVGNQKRLETTIKGLTDIPGVLWAGKISSGGGKDMYFKNSAKFATDLTVSLSSKTYTITHNLGTNNYAVQITPYSNVTYTITKASNGNSFSVTLSSTANFDLTIFGSN